MPLLSSTSTSVSSVVYENRGRHVNAKFMKVFCSGQVSRFSGSAARDPDF